MIHLLKGEERKLAEVSSTPAQAHLARKATVLQKADVETSLELIQKWMLSFVDESQADTLCCKVSLSNAWLGYALAFAVVCALILMPISRLYWFAACLSDLSFSFVFLYIVFE